MEVETRRSREALSGVEFRKSSYSSGAQECVAVGLTDVWVGIKDTKNPGVLLAVPVQGFARFAEVVKADKDC